MGIRGGDLIISKLDDWKNAEIQPPSRLIGFKLPKNHQSLWYLGCPGWVHEFHPKIWYRCFVALNPDIAVFWSLFIR